MTVFKNIYISAPKYIDRRSFFDYIMFGTEIIYEGRASIWKEQ